MTSSPIHDYIQALDKELAAGNTTEHTHRPALKALFQALNPTVTATNEPQHITAVGAPDFRIIKNKLAIGYVECKDIGKNLDEVLETEQLKRYLKSFHNFLLTDYIEFRWYVGGKLRLKKTLGTLAKNKIKQDRDGLPEAADILTSFLNNEPEPIGSPKELAGHMARLAHLMGYLINNTLKMEIATGSLHVQLTAFRKNLIPDLSVEQFADMYAQTIAYGLFAARCETDNGKDFIRFNANHLIPKTNPFLRKLFNHIAGPDLDEQLVGTVDDLAQILAQADMETVLKGFGKSTGKDDPVVHFYETFLKEYSPETKEIRGVYYTPMPVVSYIVCSVDHILKTSFGKPQGLADPGVLILDPAVGTATFLYKVIGEIYDAVVKQGQSGIWNDYVAEKLLPRLFGFEILMAPYAIAHLKLGLLLKETKYQFPTEPRLGIYLTNTLEQATKHAESMFAEWITDEANNASEIKKTKPVMVVLGKPPYSGVSANASVKTETVKKGSRYKKRINGKWELVEAKMDLTVTVPNFIGELLDRYYQVDGLPLGEKNSKWLQDDYVKFLAFGQWRIERTKYGVLAFITNHSYLDNPTFRGMRQSLLKTFTDIYILNLHRNAKKKETTPNGGKDENVFDIQQGVSISIFVKESGKTNPAIVHYADLFGLRTEKYQNLAETDIATTGWKEIGPSSPFYLFVPQDQNLLSEYNMNLKVTEIFPTNVLGFQTHRDDFAIDFEKDKLKQRITHLRMNTHTDEEIRELYGLQHNRDWHLFSARNQLRNDNNWAHYLIKCLYRPFDWRFCYFSSAAMDYPRRLLIENAFERENIFLLIPRQLSGNIWKHVGVAKDAAESCALSTNTKEGNYDFPLYLYPKQGEMQLGEGNRRPNLNVELIKKLINNWGLNFVEDGKGDLQVTFGPEDILDYVYAILHSPTYRTRYAEFLKIDFPRLPFTSNKTLFKELAGKGSVLVSLYLMESPLINILITKYPIDGDHLVNKVRIEEKTQRVYINKTQYFEGVPSEVWNFHIGGYQICEKWLKDRKGRKLSIDDINHYQKIGVALKETMRLMNEIDGLITKWPIE